MKQDWRKFDIEIDTMNVLSIVESRFDALFISTRNSKERLELQLKHLKELDIANAIYVIPSTIQDIPNNKGELNALILLDDFQIFIKEKYHLETIQWDLPLKRNFAILFSLQNSLNKILLLDDDIMFNDKNNIYSMVSALDSYWISGCYSIGEIDTSLIGGVSLKYNNKHIKFFSGNCLAVNVREFTPFFPEIYNEDWLAILPAIINHKAILAGEVTQLPRIVSDYRQIASFQEFGEIIADDIYEHISSKENLYSCISDLITKLCDLSYWEKVIKDRTLWLNILEDFENDEKTKDIISGAKETISKITPEKCIDFLETWYKQEIEWRMYFKSNSRQNFNGLAL
jgi:hypothetical protein